MSTGDVVIVYASSPVKAVLGTFAVKRVVEGAPAEVWARVGPHAGLPRSEYDRYFEGAHTAFGIELEEPVEFERPVDLDDLREVWDGFHPPQTYRYLDAGSVSTLVGMAESG